MLKKRIKQNIIRKIFSQRNFTRKRPADKTDHDISVSEQRIHKLEDSFARRVNRCSSPEQNFIQVLR